MDDLYYVGYEYTTLIMYQGNFIASDLASIQAGCIGRIWRGLAYGSQKFEKKGCQHGDPIRYCFGAYINPVTLGK